MTERRVAIVTGGARGIGLAIAKALARDGTAVVIGDVDEAEARAAAESIRASGGQAAGRRTDVTQAADAKALVGAAVAEFGRLDCAVNNAGINLPAAPMLDIDDEAWDRLFAVNVNGVRNCMRAELTHMLGAGKGAIVNVSSTLGLVGGRNSTRAAALDYATSGIRINAVCPGPVKTHMADVFLKGNQASFEEVRAAMPIGRFIEADEVAAAAVWLCSSASSGIFGQAVTIDGGWTAV